MPRATFRRSAKPKAFLLQKPNGVLTDRVQKVGPEHFGIVAIDCAKARSRYLCADFYGRVLLEPTTLTHTRGDFRAALDRVRQAIAQHDLRDCIVAIEMTGDYHRPVQRAFRAAGFETRLVHPFTSKQYRQPADPGNKTDDTDLGGIFRAATHGFGLIEPHWADDYRTLQVLRRHRRDLVDKRAQLFCQIQETLHALMPGYAECFCHLFEAPPPLRFARHTGSAEAIQQLGVPGLKKIAHDAKLFCRRATFHKIVAWAEQAPPGADPSPARRRMLATLDDDRAAKTLQITALERDLAHLVVRTPYVMLLALPGVNIVTCADLAGELGPIANYANANGITGRAGLMPTRYQSDLVDHANGPLSRRGNRRLRAVLMQTADNLIHCNHYFQARADHWRRAGKDARWIRVKIAKIFSRLAFALVAGGQLFPHEACLQRYHILGKLLEFHREHRTPAADVQTDLDAAIEHLPRRARRALAAPLQEELDKLARSRGPQPLADVLPLVLARLMGRVVQSEPEDADS
jgi:transposase